jgi:hypothetical protein
VISIVAVPLMVIELPPKICCMTGMSIVTVSGTVTVTGLPLAHVPGGGLPQDDVGEPAV